MEQYKLYVNDRSYSSWDTFETSNFNKITLNITPYDSKLFSNDVFKVDHNNAVELIHSTVRSGSPMPGVLIISGNKTYGRQHKTIDGKGNDGKGNDGKGNDGKGITRKNTGGKLLYKCIPDDTRLPSFLIPYEIKHIGFSKVNTNLYVTFTFDKWNDKHPCGKLDNVIGPVDVLDNFYEYQLYCKSLNASIQKFQKETSKAMESKTHEGMIETIKTKYPTIEDRTDQKKWHIITIDPSNSVDFDDGFSIINNADGIQQLSIYISNVTIWLDVLNLWDSFSRRISTIYLPDKKRPMLPTILSDCLCSLQENVTRIAFVIDIFIKNNEIIDIKYCNCCIKVFKNYCYEEPKLLANARYQEILEAGKKLSKKFKYISNLRNSH